MNHQSNNLPSASRVVTQKQLRNLPTKALVGLSSTAIKPATTKKVKRGKTNTHVKLLTYIGPMPMPERYRCKLRYNKTFTANNVGVAYTNFRFVPTFAYDVDPLLASTSMPMFTELTTLYRAYRVDSVHVRCGFSNNDSLNAVAFVCPINFDPGANYASYQNLLSAANCRKTMMGSVNGKGSVIVNTWFSVADFGGATNDLTTDAYVGMGSTAPLNNVYVVCGVEDNAVLVNGVWISVDIDIICDFFEYAQPSV